MKYFLIVFIYFFTTCSSEHSIRNSEITFFPSLENRDGLYYKINSSKLFSGETKSTYSNGDTYVSATFQDGKIHGTYNAWYSNGQKMGESNYKDGIKEGTSIAWHENGNKASETYFINDKKNGKLEIFYFTGEKKTEAFFIDDKLDSTLTQWDMEGNIISVETYERGVLIEE